MRIFGIPLKNINMARSLLISSLYIAILLSFCANPTQELVRRSENEPDEGSCICGLNSAILDRLESIISTSTNSCSNNKHPDSKGEELITAAQPQARDPDTFPVLSNSSTGNESAEISNQVVTNNDNMTVLDSALTIANINSGLGSDNENQKGNVDFEAVKPIVQSSISSDGFNSLTFNLVTKLTSEIHKLQTQMNTIQSQQLQQQEVSSNGQQVPILATLEPSTISSALSHSYSFTHSSNGSNSNPNQKEDDLKSGQSTSNGEKISSGTQTIIITGFLNGFPAYISNALSEPMIKLNQSQVVEPYEMTSALQSTVPNVVSNIFSSIQNLTLLAEQNLQPSSQSNSSKLTSIDGTTVEINREDSKDEITANGEKLFLIWIEHQLNNLHLTASMANYIRKSALSMFRRIVNQYVDRMTRVGGSLEYNVQRATQLALNNTQHLISFLLKNYINLAGGLMQIIGEQVSRVGKQLDVTGDKIAQTSLNPLDIVSNVIDSLPNPSNYSKYFREFSKHLIGETTTTTTTTPSPDGINTSIDSSKQHGDTNPISNGNNFVKSPGFITKTMGAVSKTLNRFLG